MQEQAKKEIRFCASHELTLDNARTEYSRLLEFAMNSNQIVHVQAEKIKELEAKVSKKTKKEK